MKLAEILQLKFPEADFFEDILIQDDGQGAYIKKWNDALGPKPDQATLAKWEAEVKPVKERLDARQHRRDEYPAIGDQLDALLKHFEQKEVNGEVLSPELKLIKDQWRAVKTKYPLE